MKKWGHLYSYHVYSQFSGHENVKNGSFFFSFATDDSKKLVAVWAKYLSEPKWSHLAFPENGMSNTLQNHRSWDIEDRNI